MAFAIIMFRTHIKPFVLNFRFPIKYILNFGHVNRQYNPSFTLLLSNSLVSQNIINTSTSPYLHWVLVLAASTNCSSTVTLKFLISEQSLVSISL